jgi:hypothetical protein
MGQGRMRSLNRVAISLFLVGGLVGATACASAAGGPSTRQNEITRAQIDANPRLATAYEVVERIRPGWLRPRGGTFSSGPLENVIFLDNVRFGSMSSLAQLSAEVVQRMEWLSSSDATTLYGTGYMGGAIRVFTR